jgi:hypothetical protein
MFGYGLNVPTAHAVLATLLLMFSLKHNITSWRVLQHEFGDAAATKWADMKARYKAWKAAH